MAIPTLQEIAFPLLKYMSDGKIHQTKDMTNYISDEFNLSPEEREEKYQSGQRRIYKGVGWAKHGLKKAGFVEDAGYGKFRITDKGMAIVNSNPDDFDIDKYYAEAMEKENSGKDNVSGIVSKSLKQLPENETPDELMDATFNTINDDLAEDLLDTVKSCSPSFFERLVVDLMLKMGYGGPQSGAGRAIGKSSDGGVDGVINEDKLGLDVIYLQAKRYENPVPVGHVRDFAGALMGKRSNKGIFITTSSFSKSAYNFIGNIDKKIILIDGRKLSEYMIEFNVGVSTQKKYEIKRIDSDYFEDI